MSPHAQLAALIGLAIVLIALALWIVLRVAKGTPEKRERRRRLHVSRNGRLGDALITEATETSLYYNYSVHGVEYSASQDIASLRDRLPAELGRLVGVANLKYAPKNPANSILICEEWSGLRVSGERPSVEDSREAEIRQAALCIILREDTFLVAEIADRQTGAVLHRPPGGGVEEGESPEQAVRRELREELGVGLTSVQPLGPVDHVWSWNGRDVRERAWLFVANSTDDPRLGRGETPELLEADGQRAGTFWRSIHNSGETLPPLCPPALLEMLQDLRLRNPIPSAEGRPD